MDVYRRHQWVWRLLYWPLNLFISHKFRMTHEDLHVEGPVLLIPNHVNAWDPLLVATSLKDKQLYYVASEHLFRLGFVSRLLAWLVAPIPRRKASTGTDTVKACLRHLRDGHSVCLFAEGEQCWDGRSKHILPATGKMVKASGATLVTYRLEGAYLSKPRWAKSVRRGRVHGHPVNVYPPELLKTMSAAEVNAAIERDIFEDAWERQRAWQQDYRGKKLTAGEYYADGDLLAAAADGIAADWEDWQRDALRRRDFVRTGDELFSDGELTLTEITDGHREELIARGTLRQFADRLCFGELVFPLSEIRSMAPVQAYLLLFSFHDRYFQIRSDQGANLRKYLEIWEEG